MENILIVLLGPTGVGKTDLAVELALHYGTEIISCDSRQFYREMKIGTAVPDQAQLERVRHHFIGFLSVRDYYSSSMYGNDVLSMLPRLFEKNRMAIMTGGSGMYIDAVCEGIDDIPDVDPEVRERYNHIYETEGLESLRTSLKILDPEYYTRVDLKNHKRIIRALEICESTGKPFSSFLKGEKSKRDFRVIKIGLTLSREELYERIDRRAELMVERGLELEASGLYEMRGLNALNSVGYKEFFDFFEGKITREQAIALIKRNSRRYAKRQLTWWKRDSSVNWYDPADKEGITGFIDMASRSDSQEI